MKLSLVCDPDVFVLRRFEPQRIEGEVFIGPDEAANQVATWRSGGRSHRYFRLAVCEGGANIECLGSHILAWVNGRVMRRGETLLLKPGSRFEVFSGETAGTAMGRYQGTVFELQADTPEPDVLTPLLPGDGEDSHLLRVLSDQLLELGHPLGERIALGTPRSKAEEQAWLEPFGRFVDTERARVQWRHGFLESVHFDCTWLIRQLVPMAAVLAATPAARLLRTLTVDFGSRFGHGFFERGQLEAFARALSTRTWPWLTKLQFRGDELDSIPRPARDALQAVAPRLLLPRVP